MKLTPNTAMRARDVSRPRAEHLAEAEAAEAQGGGPEPGAAGAGERPERQGLPRRRRGARDGGRRGRLSR